MAASTGGQSLSNRYYFPAFSELPQSDDLDPGYWAEQANGMLMPNRTWTFYGEIVHDSLSQMPMLGHRVEVRDISGAVHSVLFYPTGGLFDFGELRAGSTLFVRYAQRCFFSDLSTEAIKVEELNFVKIIPMSLDMLLYTSSLYFDADSAAAAGSCYAAGPYCRACGTTIAPLGGAAPRCEGCGVPSYCSPACCMADAGSHGSFCMLCRELSEIFNVDFERFIEYVPFR